MLEQPGKTALLFLSPTYKTATPTSSKTTHGSMVDGDDGRMVIEAPTWPGKCVRNLITCLIL